MGFVADVGGRTDRRSLEAALEALARMEHRGATGPDGTADGAGVMTPIPWELLCDEMGLSGDEVGRGRFGLAMVYSRGDGATRVRSLVGDACADQGVEMVGWRAVPVDPGVLAPGARRSMPSIEQAVVRSHDDDGTRRTAHRLRRAIERSVRAERLDVSVVSLGFETVTYKALARGDELDRFFPDLADRRYAGWFAVFHRRFSTNTTPAWERAQPCRTLAHNGEINTLSGNAARMRERAGNLGLGDPVLEEQLGPLLDERGSDSSMLDEAVDLLISESALGAAPRPLPHAISMLMPPAWERHPAISEERKAFHRWHAARMEPWDGPAAVVFSDGHVVGAALDRNGFRPLRYALGDGLIACASEAGAVDTGSDEVRFGRLGPGEMLVVDPSRGGLVLDPIDALATERPYATWLARERTTVVRTRGAAPVGDLRRMQVALGLTREDLTLGVRPMAASGHEPVFSMGDDTPIAPLATSPRPMGAFLRQRFAQVTNPPLDHLREGWVMSLTTFLGPRPNLLHEGPARSRVVELPTFLLDEPPEGPELDATWPAREGPDGLLRALDRLEREAGELTRGNAEVLVLAHRRVGSDRAPVPSILAAGAVHSTLVRAGLRGRVSLAVDGGDVWTSHDAACLLGMGVDVIVPGLADATVEELAAEGRLGEDVTAPEARARFREAIEEGVRKALARLGVSVLDAYRGARAFDAVGLADEVVDRCFPGVVSPIGGPGFRELAEDVLVRHASAFGDAQAQLASPGRVKHRRGGEYHASNPEVVGALHRVVDPAGERLRGKGADAAPMREAHTLRRALAGEDGAAYREFVSLVERRQPTAPRDLLSMRPDLPAVPIAEVEPVEAITSRFSTAAISLGAISSEAHETLARGAAMAGARANSGEGGEQPWRSFTDRSSSIKQVASARFGVTPRYLASADELQIKIAQGSKPGEGGQLPAVKVSEEIAALRHSRAGIALLSPAPHHDIYSIEDLAQLIADLRQVNPDAGVSVKLVAQVGVGVVAAGVVKAGADVVHIAGADGGTGASPLVSIRHAGLPWELGLAEARAVLVDQGLRGHARLRVDGGFRIGRDVVIAALLGADEFSFGTAALVALGCLMVRSCHLDTCPVGIATQRPELRSRFAGTPEMVATYLRFVAEDVRGRLASLGLRTLEEAIGRADLLHEGGRLGAGLDLSGLLTEGVGRGVGARSPIGAAPPPNRGRSRETPAGAERTFGDLPITIGDRTVGAEIGGRLARSGVEPEPSRLRFRGEAGQSFGAFLPGGASVHLRGVANDGVGKGLAGGRVVVVAPERAKEHPVLIGNAALYGATSGSLFVAGRAGDRFAVRNAGADAVVEGVGADGCEYMTGGVVVVLGSVGPNFAAGMTGGRAYVVTADPGWESSVNLDLVGIEPVSHRWADELHAMLRLHARLTRSTLARILLADRRTTLRRAWLVAPLGEPAAEREPAERVEVPA